MIAKTKPKKIQVTQLAFVEAETKPGAKRDGGREFRKTDVGVSCPACGAPNTIRREDWDRSVRVAKNVDDKSKWSNRLTCSACQEEIEGPRWHRVREAETFKQLGVVTPRLEPQAEAGR